MLVEAANVTALCINTGAAAGDRVVAVVFATRYCCRHCSGQYRGIHGHRRLAGVVVHRVDLGVGG